MVGKGHVLYGLAVGVEPVAEGPHPLCRCGRVGGGCTGRMIGSWSSKASTCINVDTLRDALVDDHASQMGACGLHRCPVCHGQQVGAHCQYVYDDRIGEVENGGRGIVRVFDACGVITCHRCGTTWRAWRRHRIVHGMGDGRKHGHLSPGLFASKGSTAEDVVNRAMCYG